MVQFFPRMIPPKPSYRSRNHTVIAEQLRAIGWRYKHAASFFHRHEITIAKWASGEYEPLPAERYMLQMLAENPDFRACVKEIWAAPHRGLCQLPAMQLVIQLHEPAEETATS